MRDAKTFLVASVEADAAALETASYLMAELGCQGAVEEAADLPGRTRLKAFFDKEKRDIGIRGLTDEIQAAFAGFDELADVGIEITEQKIEDQGLAWRQHFKPFAIAPGVIVAPSWEGYQAKGGEKVILLDPGMAFGTGLHETTRLCANAIAELLRSAKGTPSLLDVGTGSGILAILGKFLGAGRVCAVDNDEDAIAAARENMDKNGCPDIELGSSLTRLGQGFDIVAANILLLTLIDLRDEIMKRVAAGGCLIISGITHDQEAEIGKAYSPSFRSCKLTRMGEWSALTFMQRN